MNDEKFSKIFYEYKSLILSVCHRYVRDFHEAENLTQETFLSAYKSFDKFEGDSYKAWLVKIATNKCLDFLRKPAVKREESTQDDELYNLIKDSSVSAESEAEANQTIETVKKMCSDLKEPYSSVAYMYYIQQMTFEEIALRQKIPKKTVQTQLYRARDKLRVGIKEKFRDIREVHTQ